MSDTTEFEYENDSDTLDAMDYENEIIITIGNDRIRNGDRLTGVSTSIQISREIAARFCAWMTLRR